MLRRPQKKLERKEIGDNHMIKARYKLIFAMCFFLSTTSCSNQAGEVVKKGYYSDNESDYNLKDIVRPPVDIVSKVIKNNILVGFSWVDMPLNKILLIKSNNDFCALKFTYVKRGNNSKEATSFNSGEESFEAKYDFLTWHADANSQISLISRDNRLELNAAIGIGRLSYQPGNSIIKCGKAKLLWQYPAAVLLFGRDMETLFSPTTLTEFDDISLSTNKAVWYDYDEKRKMIKIPIE